MSQESRGPVSQLTPLKSPLRTRNICSNETTTDTLHRSFIERVQCHHEVCLGSIMSIPGRRPPGTCRGRDDLLLHAKEFIDQYYTTIKRFNSPSHKKRWAEVSSMIAEQGTYDLSETELTYGAKLAWRNAPRCIGRIQWSKLQVFDARYVTTAREMFDAICNHLKYGTNKGNIRSAITVFPQRTDGKHDFRVWNGQIISYAGYRQPDGSVIGDPINVEITKLCQNLGWKGYGGRWDILPLILSANGHDPEIFDIPEELVLRVPLKHPKYPWFEELDLQWYALPGVSNMLFDCGGLEFPAAPFNGWYMATEIGARDLCDPHRLNVLETVAIKMGLDTLASSTLWKDRALVEVNFAVLYSFQQKQVTIMDHHTASESFMKHLDNEKRLRGGCPADWVWIIPPMSGSITPVFHQEMLWYNLKPSYEYQDSAWKTHVWENDLLRGTDAQKNLTKKLKFKEIAKAVKFTSNLFGKALSRRIKSTILFATETGRSEQYAETLRDIFSHAFNVTMCCMSNYDIINLENEALLLIITSTFGNGDPPENGERFARGLQTIKVTGDSTPDVDAMSSSTSFLKINLGLKPSEEDSDNSMAPSLRRTESEVGPLSNVSFAVFGLGSSAYPNFCSFARFVDKTLGQLGAERITQMVTGDELCGQEQAFRRWARDVFQVACDVFCMVDEVNLHDVTATLQPDWVWSRDKVRLIESHLYVKDIYKGFGKSSNRRVFPCKMVSKAVLHSEEDGRTILVQIETEGQKGMGYLPGDHLGVFPENRQDLVERILKHMKETDPDLVVSVELKKVARTTEGVSESWITDERLVPCSVRKALTKYLDITTPPAQQLLALLSTLTSNEEDYNSLQQLATDTAKYETWKAFHYPNLSEVLDCFPSVQICPELLLTQLPLLQPRFYSISSSPDICQDRIDLTVAVVKYRTQNGNGPLHYGVCSNYLATLPDGENLSCFVRSALTFRPPDNKKLPVIMVGPGTGIAPFRSFWQQRSVDMTQEKCEEKENFGRLTLFFGCRTPSMELFHDEMKDMIRHNVLNEVHIAFSRMPGSPKVYVQDKLREMKRTVYQQLVHENGHFYVCGDVSMATDVNRVLWDILQDCGSMTDRQVNALMKTFQEENRYHEDIFGITLRTAEVTNKSRAEALSSASN